jgi:nitrite reductase/ring-hydroxylating ferredoxin subunit
MENTWIKLCCSRELIDGGLVIPFDVEYSSRIMRAFAIRFRGKPHAYLNECSHVAMEMDWQPNQFWDNKKQWLLCATHGAVYQPDTGACAGGPCRGGLKKIDIREEDDRVFWRTQYNLHPIRF